MPTLETGIHQREHGRNSYRNFYKVKAPPFRKLHVFGVGNNRRRDGHEEF
jgi:hypothetical protein